MDTCLFEDHSFPHGKQGMYTASEIWLWLWNLELVLSHGFQSNLRYLSPWRVSPASTNLKVLNLLLRRLLTPASFTQTT